MAITQPTIDAAEADTLRAAGTDGDTGIAAYVAKGAKEGDSPTVGTRVAQWAKHTCKAIAAINAFSCLDKEDGLKVIVKGGKYELGGTTYTLPDTDPFTCTDDSTCYLYCDTNQVVEEDTTSWPGTAHWKLAIVTTVSGEVTAITDARHLNYDPAGENQWYNVAAAGPVDMDDEDIDDLGFRVWADDNELTIASGVITPTNEYHVLLPEGAAADDLTTITANASERRFLLLRRKATGAGDITVKTTGNIELVDGVDFVMSAGASNLESILLFQKNDTTWRELWRSPPLIGGELGSDIDGNEQSILELRGLHFETVDRTISAGVVSLDASYPITYVRVEVEAGLTDDLDSAGPAYGEGALLILRPYDDAHTVWVRHAVGAEKFLLQGSTDFEMSSSEHFIMLMRTGTQWVELSRSPQRARDLITTDGEDRCVPYTPTAFIPGALSAGTQTIHIYCPYAFTLQNATGYADTGPTGGNMTVDVLDDGVTIFAAGAEKIVIADGTNSDTSATKDAQVAAGSWITFDIDNAHTAEDLTVTLNGIINLQTSPHEDGV